MWCRCNRGPCHDAGCGAPIGSKARSTCDDDGKNFRSDAIRFDASQQRGFSECRVSEIFE